MCHIDREGRRAQLSHHKVLERHFISQTSLTLYTHSPPPVTAARVRAHCERVNSFGSFRLTPRDESWKYKLIFFFFWYFFRLIEQINSSFNILYLVGNLWIKIISCGTYICVLTTELISIWLILVPCMKTIQAINKLTYNEQSFLSVSLSLLAMSPLMPHLVTNTFNSALPPQIMCHLHSALSFSQELFSQHLLSGLWPPPFLLLIILLFPFSSVPVAASSLCPE